MKIYVDADACPVVAIVEQIAKEYEIPVTLLSVSYTHLTLPTNSRV